MYVNPFVAGILVTIGFELFLVVMYAVVSTFIDRHNRKK